MPAHTPRFASALYVLGSSSNGGNAMPRRSCTAVALAAILMLAAAVPCSAALVRGGGGKTSDCVVVFDVPGANKPAPPKTPRHVDCVDGDPTCDADGLRNGRCEFDLAVCVNSTALAECVPSVTDEVTVDHAVDDGIDTKFDPDFQALQLRIDSLGFPDNSDPDSCTLVSTVTVVLKGPSSAGRMRTNKKKVKTTAYGFATGKARKDRDGVRFKCKPEGDRIYLPQDLYTGTFDRIAQQVFAQSCALSSCHDSQAVSGGLTLLPNSAYGNLVGVTPVNAAAAADGLERIFAGDPTKSLLYRKITDDLQPGYGSAMPLIGPSLSPDLIELIRLWIIGDGILGPAPETGWVQGTDQ